MVTRWHEFTSWSCESCGAENLIIEGEDRLVDKASTFERRCTTCSAVAVGKTIRPAGIRYRITTRRDFYRRRFHRRPTGIDPTQVRNAQGRAPEAWGS